MRILIFVIFFASLGFAKTFYSVKAKVILPNNEEKTFVALPIGGSDKTLIDINKKLTCILTGDLKDKPEEGLSSAWVSCASKSDTKVFYETLSMCGGEDGAIRLQQIKGKKVERTIITISCE